VYNTAKYSLISFIPVNLYEQFRRTANVYFLLISLLQVTTDLSPTNKYSTLFPLCVVLFISMVKEGVEDVRRHYADDEVNSQPASVVTATESQDGKAPALRKSTWGDVTVGSIVVLQDHDQCPADILLLATSTPGGKCRLETSNLDGESNLKLRSAVKIPVAHAPGTTKADSLSSSGLMESPPTASGSALLDARGSPMHDACIAPSFGSLSGALKWVSQLRGSAAYELPSPDLHRCNGNLTVRHAQRSDTQQCPFSVDEVVWRGTSLRNTDWVVGIVLYTGPDTRIARNTNQAPSKMGRLDKQVSSAVLTVFFRLAILIALTTIASSLKAEMPAFSILRVAAPSEAGGAHGQQVLEDLVTALILMNNMVPISLYVTLEGVRWW
jgi:magnesium-transporting ATPase (P-type)